jgi:type IV pilus assembly protein PilB
MTRDEQKHLEEMLDVSVVYKALKEEGVVAKDVLWKDVPFYEHKETEECPEGFSGRMGIYEVLSVSESIKELVMKGATSDDVHAQSRKEGMLTMMEDGIFKAAQGITTIEEVFRAITE